MNTTIALLCGLPYVGKSTLLQESNEPYASMDDFLQARYKTSRQQTIDIKMAIERPAVFKDFAEMAVKKASESNAKTFWIEGMFTTKDERLEMKQALENAGSGKVGCLFLVNVKMSELFDRCQNSKKQFKCSMVDLMKRAQSATIPDASEGFKWIEILQPLRKSLREDKKWK